MRAASERRVAGLAQAGPDAIHSADGLVAEKLHAEIVHQCVALQANLSKRLEEKRRSLEIREEVTKGAGGVAQAGLDALYGVAADDFRAEIAQECLAMESQLVQRLGELATKL